MGVEYKQYLLPKEHSFQPSPKQLGVPAGTVRKYTLSSKALPGNSFEPQNCQKTQLSIKDRDYRLVRGTFVVEVSTIWGNMVA